MLGLERDRLLLSAEVCLDRLAPFVKLLLDALALRGGDILGFTLQSAADIDVLFCQDPIRITLGDLLARAVESILLLDIQVFECLGLLRLKLREFSVGSICCGVPARRPRQPDSAPECACIPA